MRRSHWQVVHIDFLRRGEDTKRPRERDVEINTQWLMHKLCLTHSHPTLGPFGQLSGKQDVGQLALCVGPHRVVLLLAAQVLKLDLAHGVSRRGHVDDPRWGRVLQQVQ